MISLGRAAECQRQIRRPGVGCRVPRFVAPDATEPFARLQVNVAAHPLDLVVLVVKRLEVDRPLGRHREVRRSVCLDRHGPVHVLGLQRRSRLAAFPRRSVQPHEVSIAAVERLRRDAVLIVSLASLVAMAHLLDHPQVLDPPPRHIAAQSLVDVGQQERSHCGGRGATRIAACLAGRERRSGAGFGQGRRDDRWLRPRGDRNGLDARKLGIAVDEMAPAYGRSPVGAQIRRKLGVVQRMILASRADRFGRRVDRKQPQAVRLVRAVRDQAPAVVQRVRGKTAASVARLRGPGSESLRDCLRPTEDR